MPHRPLHRDQRNALARTAAPSSSGDQSGVAKGSPKAAPRTVAPRGILRITKSRAEMARAKRIAAVNGRCSAEVSQGSPPRGTSPMASWPQRTARARPKSRSTRRSALPTAWGGRAGGGSWGRAAADSGASHICGAIGDGALPHGPRRRYCRADSGVTKTACRLEQNFPKLGQLGGRHRTDSGGPWASASIPSISSRCPRSARAQAEEVA